MNSHVTDKTEPQTVCGLPRLQAQPSVGKSHSPSATLRVAHDGTMPSESVEPVEAQPRLSGENLVARLSGIAGSATNLSDQGDASEPAGRHMRAFPQPPADAGIDPPSGQRQKPEHFHSAQGKPSPRVLSSVGTKVVITFPGGADHGPSGKPHDGANTSAVMENDGNTAAGSVPLGNTALSAHRTTSADNYYQLAPRIQATSFPTPLPYATSNGTIQEYAMANNANFYRQARRSESLPTFQLVQQAGTVYNSAGELRSYSSDRLYSGTAVFAKEGFENVQAGMNTLPYSNAQPACVSVSPVRNASDRMHNPTKHLQQEDALTNNDIRELQRLRHEQVRNAIRQNTKLKIAANAKHAMEGAGHPEKKLAVEPQSSGADVDSQVVPDAFDGSQPLEPNADASSTPTENTSQQASGTDKSKGFTCDVCGKFFIRNYDLKRHKRMHDGVKPYSCEYCSRPFSRLDALQRHLRSDYCSPIRKLANYCCSLPDELEAAIRKGLQPSPNAK